MRRSRERKTYRRGRETRNLASSDRYNFFFISTPNNRQRAVYKIKCSNCQASYIAETSRNFNTRLTEHKGATRNGDANNHIAVHHQLTNHNINNDWDSAQCLTYSTNYYLRLTQESWHTNLTDREQLPTRYKRLIHDENETDKRPYGRLSENVENPKTLTKNRFFFYLTKTYLWVNLFKEK